MTAEAEELKAKLASLSEIDRAELASFLIHSVDDGHDEDVEEAWRLEIERRHEDIVSGRAQGIPADVAIARARKILLELLSPRD